jgi:putative ABC transport system permease protein
VTRAATAVAPGLPISPPLWAAGAALAVSLLVGLGFGSLPARRAALLDPVAALARR